MTSTCVCQYAISFGPFHLLPTQRLLLKGDRPVPLGSRAFDILIALVERPGELVTKRELMRVVWPDTIVVEANLTVHVTALRRALGDDQTDNRYIINIPGRGYRFVAPIIVADQPRSRSTWRKTTIRPLDPLAQLTLLIDRDEVAATPVQPPPSQRLLSIVGPDRTGRTVVSPGVGEKPVSVEERGAWLLDLAPIFREWASVGASKRKA
jgi:DNA-binding winged helix-turn-helix (wHTH) protein